MTIDHKRGCQAATGAGARPRQENTPLRKSWPRLNEKAHAPIIALLLLTGLGIRLALGGFWGTHDMEWWKVWGRESVQTGLIGIYGPTDQEVITALGGGNSLSEAYNKLGKKVKAKGYAFDTGRQIFPVAQPPIYLAAIHAATGLYKSVNSSLDNTTQFNFFINLISLLSCAGIVATVAWSGSHSPVPWGPYWLGALLIWLNPLIILNAPIQGYLDQLAALFTVVSIVAVVRENLILATVFSAFAILTKPQAVMIAPTVFVFGLTHCSLRENLRAWSAGFIAAIAVCLPWIISNRFLGIPLAILNIRQHPNAIVVDALNAWWPLRYFVTARTASPETENAARLYRQILSHADLTDVINVDLSGLPSLILIPTFAMLLFLWVRLVKSKRLEFAPLIAGMCTFAYFLFAKAVHTNHYFLMIPLFSIFVFSAGKLPWWFALLTASFLFQDLLFFGFGRNYDPIFNAMVRDGMLGLTNYVSFLNILLFLYGCYFILTNAPRAARTEPTTNLPEAH